MLSELQFKSSCFPNDKVNQIYYGKIEANKVVFKAVWVYPFILQADF